MPSLLTYLSDKRHRKKIRFALIGGLNTAIDFSIFFFLTALGINTVIANTISTSAGIVCSYTLNRKYTFSSQNQKKHQELTKFLVVTLIGLWVLQPIVIGVVVNIGNHLIHNLSDQLLRVAGKLIATGVSLIWNYVWYSSYVFKTDIKPR